MSVGICAHVRIGCRRDVNHECNHCCTSGLGTINRPAPVMDDFCINTLFMQLATSRGLKQ